MPMLTPRVLPDMMTVMALRAYFRYQALAVGRDHGRHYPCTNAPENATATMTAMECRRIDSGNADRKQPSFFSKPVSLLPVGKVAHIYAIVMLRSTSCTSCGCRSGTVRSDQSLELPS